MSQMPSKSAQSAYPPSERLPTPIVALTAFPATERHGEESGFDRYLRKPIDPFELTEKLSELLKRSA